MSDQGKIWFIYLTDHHEGPFTVAEVGEKVRQGLVNGQTLAWKDGMAEWIPAETIPELAEAFSAPAASPMEPAPKAESTGEVSLAQLLASQQDSPAPASGSAIASLVAEASPVAAEVDASEPGPEDVVWSLKMGAQVSGLYSLSRLKEIAGDGEIPMDATLWHSGWTDFRPLAEVPAVASARRAKPAGATRTNIVRPAMGAGVGSRPAGLMPITSSADLGKDDVTDPGITARTKAPGGFLAKLKSLFAAKKKSPTLKTGAVMIGKKKSSSLGPAVKKIALLVVLLSVIGGGGAVYFLFFSSPIPSDLDVLPEDKENLMVLVKEPIAQGKKFVLAQARGTEDEPADDQNPKFYVGSNMPEGTNITLTLTGKPGTLVNKISFEKNYSATLAKTHLAVFELKDDGKPLPMGEYGVKVSAEGAEPYDTSRFLGGKKGAVYDRRLKQYKEKLEKEYADEVEELREFVGTLKNLQESLGNQLDAFKISARSPAERAAVGNQWRSYTATFDGMTSQLEAKLKTRLEAPDQRYYPRVYQDVAATLGQLRQLAKGNSDRLANQTTTINFDEVQGLVHAGISSLDQVIAQAVIKSPYELQKGAVSVPAGATPAASPSP